MSGKAVALIDAERRRQVEVEGWTPEHDREHGQRTLMSAAHSYARHPGDESWVPSMWPWDEAWWKPKDHLSNLIRAGALYQAAVDVGGVHTDHALDGRRWCERQIDALLEAARDAIQDGAA